MSWRPFWCFVAALLVACVAFIVVVAFTTDPDPAPPGCAWVDMNPSKGSDIRLACVPGHFPQS